MITAPTRPDAGDFELTVENLRAIDEPVDLLRRLRRSAGSDPVHTRDEATRLVAQRLWRHWRPLVSRYGVRPAQVRSWVAGGEREVWLWITGDRPWSHVADALAGRAARRIRAGSKGTEAPGS